MKIKLLLLTLLFAVSALVSAATDVYEFENDEDRERFQQFTYDLRCPTCQSQNLAGSDALVSQDLKRELHRLIIEGKTDTEIREFMVSRYGDFIMYDPQLQANTYLLWFAPVALFVLGLGVFMFVLYKKQSKD